MRFIKNLLTLLFIVFFLTSSIPAQSEQTPQKELSVAETLAYINGKFYQYESKVQFFSTAPPQISLNGYSLKFSHDFAGSLMTWDVNINRIDENSAKFKEYTKESETKEIEIRCSYSNCVEKALYSYGSTTEIYQTKTYDRMILTLKTNSEAAERVATALNYLIISLKKRIQTENDQKRQEQKRKEEESTKRNDPNDPFAKPKPTPTPTPKP